jgi:hypothetical protein
MPKKKGTIVFPTRTKCFKQLRDAFSFVGILDCEQAHAFAAAVRSCMLPAFLWRGETKPNGNFFGFF